MSSSESNDFVESCVDNNGKILIAKYLELSEADRKLLLNQVSIEQKKDFLERARKRNEDRKKASQLNYKQTRDAVADPRTGQLDAEKLARLDTPARLAALRGATKHQKEELQSRGQKLVLPDEAYHCTAIWATDQVLIDKFLVPLYESVTSFRLLPCGTQTSLVVFFLLSLPWLLASLASLILLAVVSPFSYLYHLMEHHARNLFLVVCVFVSVASATDLVMDCISLSEVAKLMVESYFDIDEKNEDLDEFHISRIVITFGGGVGMFLLFFFYTNIRPKVVNSLYPLPGGKKREEFKISGGARVTGMLFFLVIFSFMVKAALVLIRLYIIYLAVSALFSCCSKSSNNAAADGPGDGHAAQSKPTTRRQQQRNKIGALGKTAVNQITGKAKTKDAVIAGLEAALLADLLLSAAPLAVLTTVELMFKADVDGSESASDIIEYLKLSAFAIDAIGASHLLIFGVSGVLKWRAKLKREIEDGGETGKNETTPLLEK